MQLFTVSIVVPTKNRRDDLRELLESILNQTTMPREVIVVDHSDDDRTRRLIEQKCNDFLSREVLLNYLRGDDLNRSISAARNMGAENSSGDVTCFLDDDVVLDKDFIKQILAVYCMYPDAKGVQGFITNTGFHSVFSNALNRVCFGFPRDFFEPNKCRAFPFSYPYPLTQVIECEWLIGANSSYKREILKKFQFDENLKGFSLLEDLDLSYRIHACFPHSLYISPQAKLVHKNSPVDRTPRKDIAGIMVAYPAYIFYKDIRQTLTNNMIFYWGLFVGRLILKLALRDPNEIIFHTKATLKTSIHFKETKHGNFKFMNA